MKGAVVLLIALLLAIIMIGVARAQNFSDLKPDAQGMVVLDSGADLSKKAATRFKLCAGWHPYVWNSELLIVCPGAKPPSDAIPLQPSFQSRAS